MPQTPNIRVGYGFDVHQLVAGRKLIIGGVEITFDRGLLGHSDADVLLHAICDALLGAAALGDIGRHFPDTDARYQGIDSRQLLRHVVALTFTQSEPIPRSLAIFTTMAAIRGAILGRSAMMVASTLPTA